MAKNLIIYYSHRGQNYFDGAIRDVKKGNTEYCAEFIQNAVGANVGRGLTVCGSDAQGSESTVAAWAKKCVG